MISIDLKCQFDDFKLVVDQEIPTGTIIGLFGASACGKSRLIRQLIGMDQDSKNCSLVRFEEQLWQDSSQSIYFPTEKRGIGYLPQTVDLFPHLSVEKNILFSATLAGETIDSKKVTHKKLDSILEKLDIKEIRSKFPSQISGGQKQRVGLARAIIAAKSILILDEPFSAIGEDHTPMIMQYLKSLNLEENLTILFSSHNRLEHAYLSEHLLTLRNGQVEQAGSYHSIAADIKNKFAQVPDAINTIDATAVEFDTNFSVNQLKTENHILWAGHQPIAENSNVSLEIRAKDISISLTPIQNSSILNSLRTQLVETNEISHHQYLLKLRFEDQFLIAFITKKSFVDLGLEKSLTQGLKNKLELYASFKAVSVISI